MTSRISTCEARSLVICLRASSFFWPFSLLMWGKGGDKRSFLLIWSKWILWIKSFAIWSTKLLSFIVPTHKTPYTWSWCGNWRNSARHGSMVSQQPEDLSWTTSISILIHSASFFTSCRLCRIKIGQKAADDWSFFGGPEAQSLGWLKKSRGTDLLYSSFTVNSMNHGFGDLWHR